MKLENLKVRVTVSRTGGEWARTIAVGFTIGLMWGNRAFGVVDLNWPVAILLGFAAFGFSYALHAVSDMAGDWIADALKRRAERKALAATSGGEG